MPWYPCPCRNGSRAAPAPARHRKSAGRRRPGWKASRLCGIPGAWNMLSLPQPNCRTAARFLSGAWVIPLRINCWVYFCRESMAICVYEQKLTAKNTSLRAEGDKYLQYFSDAFFMGKGDWTPEPWLFNLYHCLKQSLYTLGQWNCGILETTQIYMIQNEIRWALIDINRWPCWNKRHSCYLLSFNPCCLHYKPPFRFSFNYRINNLNIVIFIDHSFYKIKLIRRFRLISLLQIIK